MDIRYELLDKSQRKTPPAKTEGFGVIRTNHMFLADYKDGQWGNMRIVPYAPIGLMPGAVSLHYGQTIFEGGKAFMHQDGEIYVFRFDKNAQRLNHSANVTLMPNCPAELQTEGLQRLIDVEREWCPTEPESSLYIRPFMFATDDSLAVHSSSAYTFCIILSPSGPYYTGGFSKAITLLITDKYHRAVSGGTGTAKTGGNYAASLRPAEYAFQHGADQVLYLDAENKHIEEVGTMNHYHVLDDGTIIIPKFNGSVLASITSTSVLELAAQGKVKARQETIEIDAFIAGLKSGKIIEAGGFGTAAVVSPVGKYIFEDGSSIIVGDGKVGKYSREIYELYSGMQTGKVPAPEGWLTKVPHFNEAR